MSSWLARFLTSLIAVLPVVSQAATTITYTPVDLSPVANCRVQTNCYAYPAGGVPGAPEGSVTLGGIPFNLGPVGGNNGWSYATSINGTPRGSGVLTLGVNIPNPTTVYTLINTGYGFAGPIHKGVIEFKGSNGAFYAKVLAGNDDVRTNANYCANSCTNSINGITTTNVFLANPVAYAASEVRIDKQAITLPPEFQSQNLTQIILYDWDMPYYYSFVAIAGVTVASTSDPLAVTTTTVPVDISSVANCRLQGNCFTPVSDLAFPEGTVTLGGVRFDLGPVGGANAWWPWTLSAYSVPLPWTLDIPVRIPNATAVHTLINTSYGPYPNWGPIGSIEFFGSAGAYYFQYLDGDVNVRSDSDYTGYLPEVPLPPGAVNVYATSPPGSVNTHLDMQTFALGSAFQGQYLTRIVMKDFGRLGANGITFAGASVDITPAATPVITWSNPTDILFGTALGSTQLNATTNVPGTFLYFPPAGTVLQVGDTQTLSATFTPTDTISYTTASKSVRINVKPASPPASPPQIVVTKTLVRTGSNQVVVSLNLSNTGGSDALNVRLTIGKIGPVPGIGTVSGTPLPQGPFTVGKGGTVTTTLTFALGAPGTTTVLTIGGTYTGGSFNSAGRIILP